MLSYKTVVKIPGISTTFSGESMALVSETTYKIVDITKRVWDRAVKPTFYDTGEEITPLSVDYLFGEVTFASEPSGAVTVDGNYLPMTVATGVNEHKINLSSNLLNRTTYENSKGWTKRMQGQKDVSVELSGFELPWFFDSIDCGKNTSGAIDISTNVFEMESGHGLTKNTYIRIDDEIMLIIDVSASSITATRGALGTNIATHVSGSDVYVVNITYATSEPVMIEIRPGGDNIWRMWVMVESTEDSGAIADIEKNSVSFKLDSKLGAAFSIKGSE